MRRIEVTESTMGRANPSPVALSGGYRFKGRPGWPFDPATHDPESAPARKNHAIEEGRRDRIRRFTVMREQEGLSVRDAAARLKVALCTAYEYETARKAAEDRT